MTLAENILVERPVTRGDCSSVPRPCPWAASCRYGLPESPTESCALDLAERHPDGLQLAEVAKHLGGMSGERVRQLEARAVRRLAIAIELVQPTRLVTFNPTQRTTP